MTSLCLHAELHVTFPCGAAGYCSNSCRNCTCCDTFATALHNNSYSTFLQVACPSAISSHVPCAFRMKTDATHFRQVQSTICCSPDHAVAPPAGCQCGRSRRQPELSGLLLRHPSPQRCRIHHLSCRQGWACLTVSRACRCSPCAADHDCSPHIMHEKSLSHWHTCRLDGSPADGQHAATAAHRDVPHPAQRAGAQCVLDDTLPAAGHHAVNPPGVPLSTPSSLQSDEMRITVVYTSFPMRATTIARHPLCFLAPY